MFNLQQEFEFWDENGMKKYEHDHIVDIETAFQNGREDFSVYSAPFWDTSTRHKVPNLQPHNHHYSFQSPTSRSQVLTDGRTELMKMVQNMPESSYELSLKDMVDDQIGVQEDILEKKIEVEGTKKKKKRCGKSQSQMLRSQSMDGGVFLLKMFFPSCLSRKKKKPNMEKNSIVSRRPSFDGSKEKEYK